MLKLSLQKWKKRILWVWRNIQILGKMEKFSTNFFKNIEYNIFSWAHEPIIHWDIGLLCMMHDLYSHVHSSGTLLTTNIPTEEDRGCVCSLVGRVAAFLHRELAPTKIFYKYILSHDIVQVFFIDLYQNHRSYIYRKCLFLGFCLAFWIRWMQIKNCTIHCR